MKEQLSPPNKSKNELPPEVSTTLQLDPDEYRDYLKDYDMTIEQQNEFLETLWHIMRSFVELGWGLDSTQLLFNDEDQDSGNQTINTLSMNDSSETFNQVANHLENKGGMNDQ